MTNSIAVVAPTWEDALTQMGMEPQESLVVKAGEWVRYSPVGADTSSRPCAIRFTLRNGEVAAIWFMDWRNSENHYCWEDSATLSEMTEEEQDALRTQRTEDARRANAHREQQNRRAIRVAERIIRNSPKALGLQPIHPYLTRKRINPYAAYVAGNQLFIPLQDMDGGIVGGQFISENGEKRFLTGTRKKGAFTVLSRTVNALGSSEVILICEGFATSATVTDLAPQGSVIIFAVDAGNLLPVARVIRNKYPNTEIYLVGDDDRGSTNNVGRKKAMEAAEAVGGAAIFPPFREGEAGTDWNDFAVAKGEVAAKRVFRRLLSAARNGITAPPQRLSINMDDITDWGDFRQRIFLHLSTKYQLYRKGNTLVRISDDLSAKQVSCGEIGQMADSAIRLSKYAGDGVRVIPLPQRDARVIAESPEMLGAQELKAVAQTPIITPSGQLLTEAGYIPDLGILLTRKEEYGFSIQPGDKVDLEKVKTCVEALWNPVHLFPFDTPSDAAAMLAALLTTVVRGALNVCPAFLISSSVYGSGKTLLALIISLLSGGDETITSVCQSTEEMAKAILSLLIKGNPTMVLDNLSGAVGGDALAAMLTSPIFEGRLLGRSQMVAVPNRSITVATGVNAHPDADMVRRVLPINLDPHSSSPWSRQFPFNPLEMVRPNVQRLRECAVTILYAAYGETLEGGYPPIGSFGDWDRLVRHAVLWLIEQKLTPVPMADPYLGVERALENDTETGDLRVFLPGWERLEGVAEVSLSKFITHLTQALDENPDDEQLTALWDVLIQNACTPSRRDVDPRRLGIWVRRHNGRIVDDRCIRHARATNWGNLWYLEISEPKAGPACGSGGVSALEPATLPEEAQDNHKVRRDETNSGGKGSGVTPASAGADIASVLPNAAHPECATRVPGPQQLTELVQESDGSQLGVQVPAAVCSISEIIHEMEGAL